MRKKEETAKADWHGKKRSWYRGRIGLVRIRGNFQFVQWCGTVTGFRCVRVWRDFKIRKRPATWSERANWMRSPLDQRDPILSSPEILSNAFPSLFLYPEFYVPLATRYFAKKAVSWAQLLFLREDKEAGFSLIFSQTFSNVDSWTETYFELLRYRAILNAIFMRLWETRDHKNAKKRAKIYK